MNKERILMVLLLVVVGVSGYFIGKKTSLQQQPLPTLPDEERNVRQIRQEGFQFTNPLLDCDCEKPSNLAGTILLENNLRDYISQMVQAQKATHISVYFRDMNNGPWIGLGESETFLGGSLYKVPLMIAALKKAEENPLLLKKHLLYTIDMADPTYQVISDSVKLIPGHSYEFEDLLFRMIAYSDNNAKNMLIAEVGVPYFIKVLNDVQGTVGGGRSPGDLITVKEYSSFFRILFNATYLSRSMSEKALKMLSQCTFTEGIVAKLPKEIVVAHKFGEWGTSSSTGLQLHDCGIVYSHNSPYLLCVMTRGSIRQDLPGIISHISAMVYQSVNGQ